MEIAQCSDNTFRILDYGRELTAHPRRMHYLEAMYSLSEDGIIDDRRGTGRAGKSSRRWLFPADVENVSSGAALAHQSCHSTLDYRLYTSRRSLGPEAGSDDAIPYERLQSFRERVIEQLRERYVERHLRVRNPTVR